MAQLSFFAKLFIAWRKEMKLAQVDVSAALTKGKFPYDRTTITKFETGDRRPDGEFLAAMQICFNMKEEEIALWIRSISLDYRKEIYIKYSDALAKRAK